MTNRRILTVLAIVISGIVLLWLVTTIVYLAPLDRYARADDDRHLRVYALIGAGDTELWHIIRSGNTEIQVLVWARRTPTLVNDLVAQPILISIELDAPLGDRRVTDAYGHAAREAP